MSQTGAPAEMQESPPARVGPPVEAPRRAVRARSMAGLLPWMIPLAALAAVVVLGWQAWSERGPLIFVEFERGEGISAGDPVSYRGVRVGDVRAVRLSPDLRHVVVESRLRKDAAGLAVEGSQFWIVRPEISAGRVSGLDALLGPRYLECEPGSGKRLRRFTGLERPPGRNAPAGAALEVVLEAADRGSLMADSPVVYRGIKVGAVKSLALAPDARHVEVVVAIDGAYRNLVRANSKFWNASGIGLDWGLIRGLSVRTGSLETIVAGGIGFATPTRMGEPVDSGFHFPLADGPRSEWLEWAPTVELGAR
jgi:paraquat-inducible protein B